MKKFILSLILCTVFSSGYIEPSYAGPVADFKLRIENSRTEKQTIKDIKALFDLQTEYTNKYDLEKLATLYADNYVDNDGYVKKVYFKLIQDTWDTYPDITYKTEIKNIKLKGDYAIVQTAETAIATDDEDVMLITDTGTIIRLKVSDISVLGRSTQGVTLMRTNEGKVVSVETIPMEEKSEE